MWAREVGGMEGENQARVEHLADEGASALALGALMPARAMILRISQRVREREGARVRHTCGDASRCRQATKQQRKRQTPGAKSLRQDRCMYQTDCSFTSTDKTLTSIVTTDQFLFYHDTHTYTHLLFCVYRQDTDKHRYHRPILVLS